MDLKTLNISKFAIVWKGLFGGGAAVFDYLLDKSNTAAAMIPQATADQLRAIYRKMLDVRDAMARLDWIVPATWRASYTAVTRCFSAILDTLADGKVTKEELVKISDEFKLAYATWRADDVPADDACAGCFYASEG